MNVLFQLVAVSLLGGVLSMIVVALLPFAFAAPLTL
jgi:hypothetical protein